MNILIHAKKIAKTKKAEEKQRSDENKRICKERDTFQKKVSKSVKKLVSELDKKRVRDGVLFVEDGDMFNGICVVFLKGKKGYEDVWLFSVSYDYWMEEGCNEGEGVVSCKGLTIDYFIVDSGWNEPNRGSCRFSFSDYTFKKDVEQVKKWLVEYMSNLI